MHSVARLVCLAVLLAGSCTRAAPAPAPVPLIVAHRGASHLAPENTLAAFALAWELGADMIEADFFLTADGEIVCHHDRTTKRTAGHDRPVAEQTLDELKTLDVGSWKQAKWAEERIPTLEEVLQTVPAGKAIFIEIKCGPEIVPYLLRIIKASDLELKQMIVISFKEDVIAEVESTLPAIETSWISDFEEVNGRWQPTAQEVVETARRIQADSVDVHAEAGIVDEAFVRAVRQAGLGFHVWTVNEPALARHMIALGADSITTDRPGWLRERITPRE